jgi:hypothetical protein
VQRLCYGVRKIQKMPSLKSPLSTLPSTTKSAYDTYYWTVRTVHTPSRSYEANEYHKRQFEVMCLWNKSVHTRTDYFQLFVVLLVYIMIATLLTLPLEYVSSYLALLLVSRNQQ